METKIGEPNIYTNNELQVIKEFLLEEMESINKEIDSQENLAIQAKMKQYIINMFVKKLEERKEHIQVILQKVLCEIAKRKENYK